MKKILLAILLLPFFMACNHNEEEPNEKNWVDIATVVNPDQSTVFYVRLDNGDLFKAVESELSYYRPKDGQRIIANYSILTAKRDSSSYKYDIKINDVYEVLTKGIFNITPATEDSIGNDLVDITGLWVGSDYLNVEFNYPGYNQIHYINLVSDSASTYTDGKIHLEFRHNANGDYPSISRWGMVSFNLRSLQTTTTDSVNLVIHTHQYSPNADKSYNITYKYGSASLLPAFKITTMPKDIHQIH